MTDTDNAKWREFRFTYRVPDGGDWDLLEDQMLEPLLKIIGCECNAESTECNADWCASSGPIEEDDE